jgi:hypothetical protein
MREHRGSICRRRRGGDPLMDLYRAKGRALAADNAGGGRGLWRKA